MTASTPRHPLGIPSSRSKLSPVINSSTSRRLQVLFEHGVEGYGIPILESIRN